MNYIIPSNKIISHFKVHLPNGAGRISFGNGNGGGGINGVIPEYIGAGIKGGGGKFNGGNPGELGDSRWIGDGAFKSGMNPSIGLPAIK